MKLNCAPLFPWRLTTTPQLCCVSGVCNNWLLALRWLPSDVVDGIDSMVLLKAIYIVTLCDVLIRKILATQQLNGKPVIVVGERKCVVLYISTLVVLQ